MFENQLRPKHEDLQGILWIQQALDIFSTVQPDTPLNTVLQALNAILKWYPHQTH
jgi:hypothetical protein